MAHVLRPARAGDLPVIHRAELAYIRDVEPAAEPDWTRALDRNLELWTSDLGRTAVLDVDGAAAGFAMWTPRDDERSGWTSAGEDGSHLLYTRDT